MHKELMDEKLEEAQKQLQAPLYDEAANERVRASTRIDSSKLNEAFIKHAEYYHEYSNAYELASAEEQRYESMIKLAYAELDPQARAAIADAGDKPTEGKVDSYVKNSPPYRDLVVAHHAAARNAGLWRSACESMRHKKDMLVQLGANYRAEGVSELSLLQDRAKQVMSSVTPK